MVEPVKINEKEYLIKNNRITLLEGNIIYVEPIGEQTDEVARAHTEFYMFIYKQNKSKISFLINLNETGKSSPEARRTWQRLTDQESTYKVAIFGSHPVARVLASFVIRVTNQKNILFFTNKEDAMNWLTNK